MVAIAMKVNPIRFCPRCNQPYSYIEKRKKGEHIYFYAVHIAKVDGKNKYHKCYLGAKEYEYVRMMHPEMFQSLTGMHDQERYVKYLEDILDIITEMRLENGQRQVLISILEKGLLKLRGEEHQIENQKGTEPYP